jgi:ubiquinone/menaquinone biosynthesis C-methylase UbiE
MPPRFISRQLSRPTGAVGRVMGSLMNRHNARMNAFAVERLELAPTDRVLEVGFGGGSALPSLLDGASFVAGIDPSSAMVRWARSRFSVAVSEGRAVFHEGKVEAIPFEAGSFRKVCTVNTVYFWKSLEAGFGEIYRVLCQGGRLAVGFLPKERMDRLGHPADIFTGRTPQQVTAALAFCGFTQVHIQRPDASTHWNVVVATR